MATCREKRCAIVSDAVDASVPSALSAIAITKTFIPIQARLPAFSRFFSRCLHRDHPPSAISLSPCGHASHIYIRCYRASFSAAHSTSTRDMERLLSSSLHTTDVSVLTSLRFAVLPIAEVLIMCALGFVLATERIGILSPAGIKLLSKLGSAITFQKMLLWWFIPINIMLAAAIGCTIGCIVVWVVKPPPQFRKFTVIAVGIGNIGNMPLVLMDAICRAGNSPFGEHETCNNTGVAYISYGQWVGAVIVYTFVYHMLAPPKDLSNSNGPELDGHSSLTIPLVDNKNDDESKSISQRLSLLVAKCARSWATSKVRERLQQIFQPPVIASILALVVGAIPFLKNLFFVEDGRLYFFTDTLSILGAAMIPGIMLTLGANLVGGPGTSELGLRTTVAIVLVRLFVIPCVGIGVLQLAKKLGFLLDNDRVFEFVIFLQHSMPSSALVGSVAVLRNVAAKESAAVLFYEHFLSVLSVGFWLVVFLNFLL